MDTKKLEIMLDALKTGSLLQTSEVYGYTPSGLVHMMNSLEKEIGVKLLSRGYSGIKPTPECKILLPYFQEMVAMDKKIKKEVSNIVSTSQNEIQIGAYASVAKQWLPGLIKGYSLINPNIVVNVSTGSKDELYDGLINQTYDICFVSPSENYPCHFTLIAKDYFYAVIPIEDGKEYPDTYSIEAMNHRPFIMPSCNLDQDIRSVLEKNQVTPQIKAMAVDDPVVISMVSYGMGVSILSSLMLAGNHDNVAVIPLHPVSYRQIGISTNKNMPLKPHIKQFIQFVKTNPNITNTMIK